VKVTFQLTASALALAFFTQLSAAPPKVLILTGQSDEPYHHWRETTASIRALLTHAGGLEVFVNEEPRAVTADSLAGYQALVINYNGPRLPPPAEQAIESFVQSGGGLVAFHLASYGSWFGMTMEKGRWHAGIPGAEWLAWPKIIAAYWEPEKIGHTRRGPFQVRWSEGSPFGKDASVSFLANDELYHKLTLLPGTHIEATAFSSPEVGGTGRDEPIVWTNHFGRGRVFYTTLGHDAMAFYQPGVSAAFARGVEWAATGESTMPTVPSSATPNIRLLVVTGGHSYPVEFYAMLNSLPGVTWSHATTCEDAFAKPLEDRFDVILLHDMLDKTLPDARQRLRAFIEAGKGVISLHHAIVDYTDWPWWYQQVTGGKFFIKADGDHAASRYHEGVDFIVTPVPGRQKHPVLAGVGPLTLHDEVYSGMWHSPDIDVLMETNHPENDKPVVYIGPQSRARVLYIQAGHSAQTMDNPGFRRLMRNAVEWTAHRTN
jgi:type 1 glutamine amidotransferase